MMVKQSVIFGPVSFQCGQDYPAWKPSDQQNVVLLVVAGLRSKSLHSCKGFCYPLEQYLLICFVFYNFTFNDIYIYFIVIFIYFLIL